MYSNRQLKVGETIKRALAEIIKKDVYIQELGSSMLIISKVLMTADLGIADAYISPLIGSTISEEKLLTIMNNAAPKIRHALAKKVFLKKLPQIRFKIDGSYAEAARIEELLKS